MNRTCLIDCKNELIEGSRFANRFSADHITTQAFLIATHNRRIEQESGRPRKEQFQNIIVGDFFGLRLIVCTNWLIGVACLGSRDQELLKAQELAARYYLSQFWAEFSIEVLHDFAIEDQEYRRQKINYLEGKAAKKRIEAMEE